LSLHSLGQWEDNGFESRSNSLSLEKLKDIRRNHLDEEAEADVSFFLWAVLIYCVIRLISERLFPGKVKGYTLQQYGVTLAHQAVLLPLLCFAWVFGAMPKAPTAVYLLTGAYMTSDSIINYSPVSGCVAGVEGRPLFSWSVHAHHVFTLLLCVLGTTLPPWLEQEGAICILLGEAGSLWITVTLLRPSALNFKIRLHAFQLTRVLGVCMALDMTRQLESQLHRTLLVAGGVGVGLDNWRTLLAMRRHAKDAEGKWPLGGNGAINGNGHED